MGRLKAGEKPKKQFNYKFPSEIRTLMDTARDVNKHPTETDFVIDAIREKSVRKLGKEKVKNILNGEI